MDKLPIGFFAGNEVFTYNIGVVISSLKKGLTMCNIEQSVGGPDTGPEVKYSFSQSVDSFIIFRKSQEEQRKQDENTVLLKEQDEVSRRRSEIKGKLIQANLNLSKFIKQEPAFAEYLSSVCKHVSEYHDSSGIFIELPPVVKREITGEEREKLPEALRGAGKVFESNDFNRYSPVFIFNLESVELEDTILELIMVIPAISIWEQNNKSVPNVYGSKFVLVEDNYDFGTETPNYSQLSFFPVSGMESIEAALCKFTNRAGVPCPSYMFYYFFDKFGTPDELKKKRGTF